MSKTRPLSKGLRLGLIAFTIVLSVTAAASVAVYWAATGAMKQEVQDKLAGIAGSAARLVDGSGMAAGEVDDPGYRATLERFRAIIAGDPAIGDIYTMALRPDGTIYFIVDTQTLDGSAPSEIGDPYTDASPRLRQAFETRQARVEDEPYTDQWGTVLSAYAPVRDARGGFLGMVGVDMRVSTYEALLGRIRNALAIGLAVGLLSAAGCGFAAYRIRSAMLRTEADSLAKDEALRDRRHLEEKNAAEEAARSSRNALVHEFADTFERSVRKTLGDLVDVVAVLNAEAETMTDISQNTLGRSTTVSRVSADAARSSSQIASAAEELTASIRGIRHSTDASSGLVKSMAEKGQNAKDVADRLVRRSTQIGDVVGVVESIARQINLLALNATIESARVGAAGRGFAVVAAEVKNLSNQVSEALGEITGRVADIQLESRQSVQAIDAILGSIAAVSENSVAVASAMSQQTAATDEIAQNIHVTAAAAGQIADTMTNVLSSANATESAAGRVRAASASLREQSLQLNSAVDGFLGRVRAAQ